MSGGAKFIGIRRHRLATDGEGVTTLAAFWGCPLRCRYCLNPYCMDENFKSEMLTPRELYDRVKIDDLYFRASGGGVTFGGGEPLFQIPFLREFRALCGDAWRLYAESSLNVPRVSVEEAAEIFDGFIVDVKDTNPDIYRRYTERDNAQMLQNLAWLIDKVGSERVLVRLPLIPDFNTEDDRARSRELLKSMGVTRFDEFEYIIRQTKK
ncbi:MAG: radical SAM protein [Clostridia bacterium]|nr:radical SAM protein [Clostridia bacterium]